MAKYFIDLTGQRFGKLRVLRQAGRSRVSVTWVCVCDCGAERAFSSTLLRRGEARSCTTCGYRVETIRNKSTKVNLYDGESKKCTGCSEIKRLSQFYAHDRGIGGAQTTCKLCRAEYVRYRKYGITPADQRALLKFQSEACPICTNQLTPTTCVLDHDHSPNGQARGFVHDFCNARTIAGYEYVRDMLGADEKWPRLEDYLNNSPYKQMLAQRAQKEAA